MKVLDLFSGIGGFSLGLEHTGGFSTVAFCEIEPFPRAVLAKHWPEVPCYEDVRTLTADRLRADGISVDVICGGFPCQDISVAGRGAGLAGERSGLWSEYARLIEEIRPRWVIIENVAILRSRGLEDVLGALDALGYDAEWHCIPASAIGAPHHRDRLWILAYPNSQCGRWIEPQRHEDQRDPDVGGDGSGQQMAADLVANGDSGLRLGQIGTLRAGGRTPSDGSEALANARRAGLPGTECSGWSEPVVTAADIRRSASERRWGRTAPGLDGEVDGVHCRVDGSRPVEAWEGNTPRIVGRGFPNRSARLKAIGNSVVPQIPELIGRAILRREAEIVEARHAA